MSRSKSKKRAKKGFKKLGDEVIATQSKSGTQTEGEKSKYKKLGEEVIATQSKSGTQKERKKRKYKKGRKETYNTFIYRVLKQVHPEIGISKRGMSIMDSFVKDIFERLACEASRLVKYNKKHTMAGKEIASAVRLSLPGELSKHALSEGSKALAKYTSSKLTV